MSDFDMGISNRFGYASTPEIKNLSLDDSGPKRGCVGLDILLILSCGEGKNLNAAVVQELFREYGFLKRIVIDVKDSRTVNISAKAASVSEALRIFKNQQGGFDFSGFKGTLRITLRKERVGLKFKKTDERHYDFSMERCEYWGRPTKYNPNWYGRNFSYLDYKDVMSGWPEDKKHAHKYLLPDYSTFPEVAQFWRKNCGTDFLGLVAKVENRKHVMSKAELNDFYIHLFNAIFDMGMGCIRDDGLIDEVFLAMGNFSGWVIDVMQKRAWGLVMVAEYVSANFPETPMDLGSESSDEQESSRCDQENLKEAMERPFYQHTMSCEEVVSGDIVEATRVRLKKYATKQGPLYYRVACDWTYAMTVYRDKVFHARTNSETAKFEVLNAQNTFVSGDNEQISRLLWLFVLIEKGYQRFQSALDVMNDTISDK